MPSNTPVIEREGPGVITGEAFQTFCRLVSEGKSNGTAALKAYPRGDFLDPAELVDLFIRHSDRGRERKALYAQARVDHAAIVLERARKRLDELTTDFDGDLR